MNIYSKNKQRLCKNTLKKQQNIILKTKKIEKPLRKWAIVSKEKRKCIIEKHPK